MPQLIRNVRNRNKIEFDRGGIDEWCVYLSLPGRTRYAPRDVEYFSRLQQLGNLHGRQKIYHDFVQIYTPTGRSVDGAILDKISALSVQYGADAEEIEVWLTVIYAGMIAEENKQGTKLKKRIKRLGMHQLLMEGLSAAEAANFSRGKKWGELDALMKEKGF